jgi:phage antirepressor YoqD-like protein
MKSELVIIKIKGHYGVKGKYLYELFNPIYECKEWLRAHIVCLKLEEKSDYLILNEKYSDYFLTLKTVNKILMINKFTHSKITKFNSEIEDNNYFITVNKVDSPENLNDALILIYKLKLERDTYYQYYTEFEDEINMLENTIAYQREFIDERNKTMIKLIDKATIYDNIHSLMKGSTSLKKFLSSISIKRRSIKDIYTCLREKSILGSGQNIFNIPSSEYIDKGYFNLKSTKCKSKEGGVFQVQSVIITEPGKLWLVDHLVQWELISFKKTKNDYLLRLKTSTDFIFQEHLAET